MSLDPHRLLGFAFAAAIAILAFALLNPTIWKLAPNLDGWRMTSAMSAPGVIVSRPATTMKAASCGTGGR